MLESDAHEWKQKMRSGNQLTLSVYMPNGGLTTIQLNAISQTQRKRRIILSTKSHPPMSIHFVENLLSRLLRAQAYFVSCLMDKDVLMSIVMSVSIQFQFQL